MPLVSTLPHLRAEAVYAARYEMAQTLDDVLSRRIPARRLAAEASAEAAEDAARLVAPELGWSEADIARQVSVLPHRRRRRAGGRRARAAPRSVGLSTRPGRAHPADRHRGATGRCTGRARRRPGRGRRRRSAGRLADACADVQVGDGPRAEAGRDWWPLAMQWALAGQVAALPAVVARPTSADEVAAVLRPCNEARVPVTPAAGRSGVCGASVPGPRRRRPRPHRHGRHRRRGRHVARSSTSLPGTFGDVFEDELRADLTG